MIYPADVLCIALGISGAAKFSSVHMAHAASSTAMVGLYVASSGSDSNCGTEASPFRTILAASSAARPGATIHVAPGTYYGGFQTTVSGTASAPIHYVSDTKWGAIIV